MRVIVFEQQGSGRKKIEGLIRYAPELQIVRVVNIDQALPELIDLPEDYLADDFEADLVLDFLRHPDLSDYLIALCRRKKIPVVASGKKNPDAFTPFTCCGLGRHPSLGDYAARFGLPEFRVSLDRGRILAIEVLRGAPCGATWEAVALVIGKTPDEAEVLLSREVQYRCVADPSGWDPVSGKSPVHHAGHVHAAALRKAASEACEGGKK